MPFPTASALELWPAKPSRWAQGPMPGSQGWGADALQTGPQGYTPRSPPPVTKGSRRQKTVSVPIRKVLLNHTLL